MNTDKNGMKETGAAVLGITGGVGAGKSTVLSYLKDRYDAFILEADAIGHQMQQPGNLCWERIVDAFGSEILNNDQTINRQRLGSIVYADREKLNLLNAIIHPAVKAHIRKEIAENRDQGRLIVIEAALLLEDHYEEICDEIWYIYADDSVRMERLIKSRGYSPEKVSRNMKNQLSEEEFRRRCAVVIDNSGADFSRTYEQIDRAIKNTYGRA